MRAICLPYVQAQRTPSRIRRRHHPRCGEPETVDNFPHEMTIRANRGSKPRGHRVLGDRLLLFDERMPMHLFQILLPLTDNTGQPFTREDFDGVKEELASRFQGVTAYLQAPAEGLWRKGATVRQ